MKKPRRELLPGCIFGYYLATTTTENCCTSLNDAKSKMTLYRLMRDTTKRNKMDKPQLITRRSLVQIRPPQPPSILKFSGCFFVLLFPGEPWAFPQERDKRWKNRGRASCFSSFCCKISPEFRQPDETKPEGHFRLDALQKICYFKKEQSRSASCGGPFCNRSKENRT